MKKKIFNQPSLKVVRMHNNIIATSFGVDATQTNSLNLVGGREVWDDEEDY